MRSASSGEVANQLQSESSVPVLSKSQIEDLLIYVFQLYNQCTLLWVGSFS